jgi:CheY-like chemotaxis protein
VGPLSETPRHASLQILVVDDDPIVTRMLSRVLSSHVVQVANSGAGALERLSQHQFDLILCDLTMPGMSGMELYRAIEAESAETAERVIFMTGGAFTREGQEFLARVPNGRLEKPFDIRALRAVAATRSLTL